MAHVKAIGAGKYGKDSRPKYRGVKLFDGQEAKVGSILVRQTGSSFRAGDGVRTGSDYTLYAIRDGLVKFSTTKKAAYDGRQRVVKLISVLPR
ncbi:MAG TPA: 50S ribosomal protein L27 [Candidatus Paceibacterota bacterium]|nr:50S ribosomal protein L27 [Candidatus Paceibacterota bacterium]